MNPGRKRSAAPLAFARVELHSAHDAWARGYRTEESRILEAIGADVLEIQHVGSTAILGVPAKPILDILIGVARFEEAVVCIRPMESIGYRYRGENGIPRRHYFVRGDPRTHNVHMVELDSTDWRKTLEFRDYLRSNPAAARRYSHAKTRLAERFRRHRQTYQREKDKVIERLLSEIERQPRTA